MTRRFLIFASLLLAAVALCQVSSRTVVSSKFSVGLPSNQLVSVHVTNTQATLAYTAPNSSPCTVEISPSATLSPSVIDTDATLYTGASTDARDTALTNGTSRVFVAGKRTVETALNASRQSRALQAATTYYFRVCGLAAMTGSFTTANIATGSTWNDVPQVDPGTPGGWMLPTMPNTRGAEIIDPQTGVLLKRATVTADEFGGNWGIFLGYGGLTNPFNEALQSAPDGTHGYLWVGWQANDARSSLYYTIPATGVTRNLGGVFIGSPAVVPYPEFDENGYVYAYDDAVSPAGYYRFTYNGDFTEQFSASFTRVSLASQYGAGRMLHDFNPSFIDDGTYNCGYTRITAGGFTAFFCYNSSTGSQDTTGWWGYVWGGDGRPYDPTCHTGGTGSSCPQVIGGLITPPHCWSHNWEPVPNADGLVQLNVKDDGSGLCSITAGASITWWLPLTDPTGSSLVADPIWDYGGHDAFGPLAPRPNGPSSMITESGFGWDARHGSPVISLIDTAVTHITSSTTFAGVFGQSAGQTLTKHPAWTHDSAQSSTANGKVAIDFTPFAGGNVISNNPAAVLVSGKTQIYKYASLTGLGRKQIATIASTGGSSLRDVSGPLSVILDGSPGAYTYCVAYVNGECVAGSSAGDIYVNVVSGTNLFCRGGDSPAPDVVDICITPNTMFVGGVDQIYTYGASDAANIAGSRVLTHGLAGIKMESGFPLAKALPDSSWSLFTIGLATSANHIHVWAAKIPPYPVSDGKDRTTFLRAPISITTPSGQGIATATVEFGYSEYGTAAQHYCTSRAEACVVGAASVTDATPFQYKTTDTPVRLSCASSCTPSLPVLPGHTAYWTVKFYDGSGTYVADGPSGVAVEDVPVSVGTIGASGVGLSLGTDASAGYFAGLSRFFDWYTATPTGGCTNGASGLCVGTGLQGDTYFWTAWMPDASKLPVTSGLPIVGSTNDANFGTVCPVSNINVLQLDTWSWAAPTASHITKINCMSSYGSGPSSPGNWNGALTSGDGQILGTWKSRTPFSIGGNLFLPVTRQYSPGDPSVHDATLIVSTDGGQHWCNPYTFWSHSGSPGCDSSNWRADGDAPRCDAASSAAACTNAGYTDASHSSILFKGFPYGTENWYWVNYGVQDGAATPTGINDGCDPASYACFISYDGSVARVPLPGTNIMDRSQWRFYTCSTITQNTRCDPSNSANWTATFANRTATHYFSWYLGPFEENFTQLFGVQWLKEFGLYIKTGAIQPSPDGFDMLWAPSIVGPWKLFARNLVVSPQWASFFTPSPALGNTVISTNPPHIRLSTSANSYEGGEGTTHMHQWDIVSGTAPAAFPLLSSGLVWAFTFQDQGPSSSLTNWPFFLDTANNSAVLVPSDGTSYTAMTSWGGMNSGHGTSMNQYGISVSDTNRGYFGNFRSMNGEMQTGFVNAPSAMQGNGTYTVASVFSYAGGSPAFRLGGIWSTGANSGSNNTAAQLVTFSGGQLALTWNGDLGPAYTYGTNFTFTTGNWYFIATTVTAATGGNCAATSIYVGTSGSVTDRATTCAVGGTPASSKTPNVSASPFVVGLSVEGDTTPGRHALTMIYNRALTSGEVATLYGQAVTLMAARGITLQ